MLSTTHSFNVWHPSQGGLPKYEIAEFNFDRALDRKEASTVVEKIEGYVIARNYQIEKRVRQRPVKNKIQKVS